MRASRFAAIAFAVLAAGVVGYQHLGGDRAAGVAPGFGAVSLIGPSEGRSFANRLIAGPQGGAALLGQSDDAGWLARLDRAGAVAWSDQIEAADGAKASQFAAAFLPDGGLATVGSAWSTRGAPTIVLRRYGAQGAPNWETLVEVDGFFAQGHGAATLAGGDLIAALAVFGRSAEPSRQTYIGRFGPDGAQRWLRDDLPAWAETATSLDGVAVIAGWTPADAGDDASAFWVARLDDDGAPVWTRELRSGAADRALALTADDARVFAAGFRRDASSGDGAPSAEGVVVAYAADGALLWSAVDAVDGADVGFDRLAATGDGGVVAAGYAIGRQDGASVLILHRFDADGALVWRRTVRRTAQLNAISGLAVTGDELLVAVSAAGDASPARVALFRSGLDDPGS